MPKGHIQKSHKKRANHRLKIIQGQLRGLEKIVEAEKYCVDILHQSLAIQESLKSFDALMLENHLSVHGLKAKSGKDSKKSIQELIQLFRLRGRSS